MVILKKLIFAPFFILIFGLLIYQINPLFTSFDFIFSLSFETFIQLVILSGLIAISSLFFTLFITLSGDWKFVLPVIMVAISIPILFIPQPLNIVLSIGILISLLISYLSLETTLKSYLDFEPNSLFGPAIRHLASLLILAICFSFFLSVNKHIQQNGFQIPDSLIETTLKFTPLEGASLLPQDLIKQTIKDQLDNLFKPYLGIIPAVLAILLFLTLQSLTSMINLLAYPFLWLIFYALERFKIVTFTTEMRPVKKMVV